VSPNETVADGCAPKQPLQGSAESFAMRADDDHQSAVVISHRDHGLHRFATLSMVCPFDVEARQQDARTLLFLGERAKSALLPICGFDVNRVVE
jgi:hypothetical protein